MSSAKVAHQISEQNKVMKKMKSVETPPNGVILGPSIPNRPVKKPQKGLPTTPVTPTRKVTRFVEEEAEEEEQEEEDCESEEINSEEDDDYCEEDTQDYPVSQKYIQGRVNTHVKKEQYMTIPIEQKLTYKISSNISKPLVNFNENSPDTKKILLYVTHVEELVSLLQNLKSIITGIAPSIDIGSRIELNVNNLQVALGKSQRNSLKKRKRSQKQEPVPLPRDSNTEKEVVNVNKNNTE
jgi:hypothetical protein